MMLLARFWHNRHGGIAPMLAITIVPLIGAVGAAVDYTRASAARSAMQTSLDSTALFLSKTASTATPADLQVAATNTFNALFQRTDVRNVEVTASYSSTSGSKITMTSSGEARMRWNWQDPDPVEERGHRS